MTWAEYIYRMNHNSSCYGIKQWQSACKVQDYMGTKFYQLPWVDHKLIRTYWDCLIWINLNPSLILRNIDITDLIEVQLQISVLGQKYLTAFDVPNAYLHLYIRCISSPIPLLFLGVSQVRWWFWRILIGFNRGTMSYGKLIATQVDF